MDEMTATAAAVDAPAVPPAIRFSVGVVAHNEGTKPDGTSRLHTWLEHWCAMMPSLVAEIVLILHDCDDDSDAIARSFGIEPHVVNIAGIWETVLWETIPLADPSLWHIRTGGIDEFVTREHMEAIAQTIMSNPDVRFYWIARRNFCDDVDISDILGPDWQMDLMLPEPPPIDADVACHQYPKLLLPGWSIGMIDPNNAYIEHRRTWHDIEYFNHIREGFLSPEWIDKQNRFVESVRTRMRERGKDV